MLLDQRDSGTDRVTRRARSVGLGTFEKLTGAGLIQAGEDPHQRCLACPVFAQDGKDLTVAALQAHVGQCSHEPKVSGYPGHRDGRGIRFV